MIVRILCAAAIAVASLLAAAPVAAQGRVTVTNDRGTSQADLRYQTKLTIEGSGFQAVRGGFGGIYLMFGWVSDPGGGAWRPSRGGLTGEDYRYIPDAENAADNKGYLKFIAFPGSSTASEAHGVLSRSGGFQVDLTIPGPVFQSIDRDGDLIEVDCRRVTCGVITIGAHGVKNANNESFTPVAFTNLPDAAAPEPTEPSASADASAFVAPDAALSTPAGGGPRAAVPSALRVDRTTAIAGHALAFSAQGFRAGEQVVAVLDDGVAGLGPLGAGTSGEIAGVLQLPIDLEPGTHELRLRGAASGVEVVERFPVSSADEPPADASTTKETDPSGEVFLGVAVGAFLLALAAFLIRRPWRRRRATTAGATT